MVRATSSRKIKPVNKYKKATKKDKHNQIKSIITNGINKDTKEEKNIKIRNSNNCLESKTFIVMMNILLKIRLLLIKIILF